MYPFGSLHSENMELLEHYRQLWEQDPTLVDDSWRAFFSKQPIQKTAITDNSLYRMFGHLEANTYPVDLHKKPLSSIGNDPTMRAIYCGSIGYEFYPQCPSDICDFIISKIEPLQGKIALSKEAKQKILHQLNKAESFETFLHTKYVGQKRFSLEGAETLIPMLATFLDADLDDLVIGMPHRGRLNVLVNILQKSYDEIFTEFEDVATDTFEASGDVKYHKGYSSKLKSMNIRLAANPSHLESVDGVVEGIARARQTGKAVTKVLPVLVHGDAAVSGQGVVYETLQMAKLAGYTTGGTIHIVINNHIGFTTLPVDGRSTQYCTDIARTFGIPVFHVNAEDPESCLFVTKLALEIRQKFGSDVFIDMNCWRKYGHNESDEPAFTQPLTYQTIRKKPSIRTQYHDKLVKEGVELKLLDAECKNELQEVHTVVRGYAEEAKAKLQLRKIEESTLFALHAEAVDKDKIHEVVRALTTVPQGFTLHPRLLSQIEARKKSDLQHIDWAFAEALAFGTLLQEHVPIRLAGQDSRRGTFSQRHGVWFDQATGASYTPHTTIDPHFEIIDSYLSEYAALAFEY
ncbi:MAG: hypothetical protein LLF94_04020, partial [Chlamydiales bacterium]|nr:hypothetical protein [Chlamydiales bacterium]